MCVNDKKSNKSFFGLIKISMSKTRIHIPLKHINNTRLKSDNYLGDDKQILSKRSRDAHAKTA